MMRNAVASPGSQSRNALCACGSGRKYKLCCGAATRPGIADAPITPFDRAASGRSAPDTLTEAGRISDSADVLRREWEDQASIRSGATLPWKDEGQRRDVRTAQEQHRRGLQLLHAGQADAAIPPLRKAILLHAKNADAHHALGLALLEKRQFSEAAFSFAQTVALKPAFAIGHRDLGHALDLQGSGLEAIAAYQRAVTLAPKLAEVHRRLGELYMLHGHAERAIACFNDAAAAAPDTTLGRIYRANAFILAGDRGAAELWLRKALVLDPASHEAHTALAGLLTSRGRFDEAIEQYEAALRLNPSSAGPWSGIARARQTGRCLGVCKRS